MVAFVVDVEGYWLHSWPHVDDAACLMKEGLVEEETNIDQFPSCEVDLYLVFLETAGELLGWLPSRFRLQ